MLKRLERNIASYAVDLVVALGSETGFCLTGGMAMHLNRAISSHAGLRPVFCQHEQACVAAAEGYAKAADFRKAGFAVVTAGPGVSNTVTSLISAYGDSTPLIVLAGQIKTADIDVFSTRTHGIQEIRSEAIVTPCVKRFARLGAHGFRTLLMETLSEAFSGRPGPVFVEIPLDIQGIRFDYSESDISRDAESVRLAAVPKDQADDAEKLAECLAELLASPRPLLYVGNGCRIAGVEEPVRRFLNKHSIPAVFSWLSFDMVAANDALNFGCPGGLAPISANEILSRAETIVFLGGRLDLGTTAFQRSEFGGQAKRIVIDVDANELAKFAGLARVQCVQADLRGLPGATNGLARSAEGADPAWLLWCKERRAAYLAEERERLASGKLNVYGIAQRLSRWSDGKIFVPASSGYAEETLTRFFEPGEGVRFFNGAALGSMGLGLPHAIGAAFGSARQVICCEADGGLMLNIQELATLVHYQPKGFVLFVLNNHGYESIRASQVRFFGDVNGVDRESGLYIPDFARLAGAFGLRYVLVESLQQLDSLLPQLSAQDEPVMVDLAIERFEYRGPAVKTLMSADGQPSTTPLSEINW